MSPTPKPTNALNLRLISLYLAKSNGHDAPVPRHYPNPKRYRIRLGIGPRIAVSLLSLSPPSLSSLSSSFVLSLPLFLSLSPLSFSLLSLSSLILPQLLHIYTLPLPPPPFYLPHQSSTSPSSSPLSPLARFRPRFLSPRVSNNRPKFRPNRRSQRYGLSPFSAPLSNIGFRHLIFLYPFFGVN